MEIFESEGGFVAFDGERNRVHQMNVTALAVLELCDGVRTVDAIARLVASVAASSLQPSAVEACLASLYAEGIVQ